MWYTNNSAMLQDMKHVQGDAVKHVTAFLTSPPVGLDTSYTFVCQTTKCV